MGLISLTSELPDHRETKVFYDQASSGSIEFYSDASGQTVIEPDSTWNTSIKDSSPAPFAIYSIQKPSLEIGIPSNHEEGRLGVLLEVDYVPGARIFRTNISPAVLKSLVANQMYIEVMSNLEGWKYNLMRLASPVLESALMQHHARRRQYNIADLGITLGRYPDTDIQIPIHTVSRAHAIMHRAIIGDDVFLIVQDISNNGTAVRPKKTN